MYTGDFAEMDIHAPEPVGTANAARGAGLLALGIPVYLYWSARRALPTPPAPNDA